MPEETIIYAKEASKCVESINEKIGEEGSELIDVLTGKDDEQAKIIDRIAVYDLIDKLNFRGKEIIKLRYFNDKTQTQVAKILGISQVHVSRIEKKILNDFKDKLIV